MIVIAASVPELDDYVKLVGIDMFDDVVHKRKPSGFAKSWQGTWKRFLEEWSESSPVEGKPA